jgi:hypothetical protein
MEKFRIRSAFKLARFRTKRIFTPYGELIIGRKTGSISVSAVSCGRSPRLAIKKILEKPQRLNYIISESAGDFNEGVNLGMNSVNIMPVDEITFLKDLNSRFNAKTDIIIDFDLLKSFLDKFDDPKRGLAVINSLFQLYMYHEFPELFFHSKEGSKRIENENEIPMLEELKKMGFVVSYPKDKYARVRLNALTKDGLEISRAACEKMLRMKEDELEKLIHKFEPEIIFFIVAGTIDKKGMNIVLREPDSVLALKSVKNNSIYSILPKIYSSDLTYLKSFKKAENLLRALAMFITEFVIYDEAIRFFDELSKIGFAVRTKVYSKAGVGLGEEYRAPLEVAEFLMDRCYFEVEDELLKEFAGSFAHLYGNIFDKTIASKRVIELFLKFGLSLDEIREILSSNPEESTQPKIRMAETVTRIMQKLKKM